MSDDLSLVVGGRVIAGWTELRVTRGIERLPSDFEISLTERYPGEADDLVIQPNDQCQVMLGSDLVLTGYVDRYMPEMSAREHRVTIVGRGKCADLIDCSAEWPNGQISGASALGIAQKLAEPYGITVSSGEDGGPAIPQFNLMYGETAFEIIERICRYSALLAYDLPDGNLYLARAGSSKAASGVAQGQNIQAARASYGMDGRYSEYEIMRQSMEVLTDTGNGGNLLATVNDAGVNRHRRLFIVAESGGGAGQDVAIKRGYWEAARRAGRSNQIQVVVDSWRDGAGALWSPNTVIPVDIPCLKVPDDTWLLAEVTYFRGEEGTGANLLLMPQSAFQPQPILLQPFAPDVPTGVAGN